MVEREVGLTPPLLAVPTPECVGGEEGERDTTESELTVTDTLPLSLCLGDAVPPTTPLPLAL